MTKILLVDDHELVRTGIKLLLQQLPAIDIVGECETGEDAIIQARELKPDIVFMDLKMPGIGGLEATLRIMRADPEVKVLVWSVYTDHFLPARLMNLGVAGFLTKKASGEQLLKAIQSIQNNVPYIDSALFNQTVLPDADPDENPEPLHQLSEREFQILLMVARGIETEEIARKLFLSSKTVNGYRGNILKKLNVKTDVEAARVAIKNGLVDVNTEWH